MKEKLLAAMLFSGLATTPFTPAAAAAPEPAMQAGAICKTTLGLNPANADYDACERPLLEFRAPLMASDALQLPSVSIRSPYEESCALAGVAPASDAFLTCARTLDAALFEMNDSAAE